MRGKEKQRIQLCQQRLYYCCFTSSGSVWRVTLLERHLVVIFKTSNIFMRTEVGSKFSDSVFQESSLILPRESWRLQSTNLE